MWLGFQIFLFFHIFVTTPLMIYYYLPVRSRIDIRNSLTSFIEENSFLIYEAYKINDPTKLEELKIQMVRQIAHLDIINNVNVTFKTCLNHKVKVKVTTPNKESTQKIELFIEE